MEVWKLPSNMWGNYITGDAFEEDCQKQIKSIEADSDWTQDPQKLECWKYFSDTLAKFSSEKSERERKAAEQHAIDLQIRYADRLRPGRKPKYQTEEQRRMARAIQVREANRRFYARHKSKPVGDDQPF